MNRRSTIRDAVLNAQRAESSDYGSSSSPTKSPPSSSNRSRFGMSSGGGPSSINLFDHAGQGSYGNPYEKAAAAVVAPRDFNGGSSFAGRAPMSRDERMAMMESSSRESSPPDSRSSRMGAYGSNYMSSASNPSGQQDDPAGRPSPPSGISSAAYHDRTSSASPAYHERSSSMSGSSSSSNERASRRGYSWGGGNSSNMASALSWSSPQPPSYIDRRRRSSSTTTTTTSSGGNIWGTRANDDDGGNTNSYKTNSYKSSCAYRTNASSADNNIFQSSPYAATGSQAAPAAGFQPSVRVSAPPGGASTWKPGWG